MDKVLKLDDVDKELITVSLIIIQFKGNFTQRMTEYIIADINSLGWMVYQTPAIFLVIQHPVYSCATPKPLCMDCQESSH